MPSKASPSAQFLSIRQPGSIGARSMGKGEALKLGGQSQARRKGRPGPAPAPPKTGSSLELNAPRDTHSFRWAAGRTWARTCRVLSPPPLTAGLRECLENLGGAVPPSPPRSDRGRGPSKAARVWKRSRRVPPCPHWGDWGGVWEAACRWVHACGRGWRSLRVPGPAHFYHEPSALEK